MLRTASRKNASQSSKRGANSTTSDTSGSDVRIIESDEKVPTSRIQGRASAQTTSRLGVFMPSFELGAGPSALLPFAPVSKAPRARPQGWQTWNTLSCANRDVGPAACSARTAGSGCECERGINLRAVGQAQRQMRACGVRRKATVQLGAEGDTWPRQEQGRGSTGGPGDQQRKLETVPWHTTWKHIGARWSTIGGQEQDETKSLAIEPTSGYPLMS